MGLLFEKQAFPAATPLTATGHELSVGGKPTEAAIALISNALEPPPDEGIKRCGQELALADSQTGAAGYSRFRKRVRGWLERCCWILACCDPLRRSETRGDRICPDSVGNTGERWFARESCE